MSEPVPVGVVGCGRMGRLHARVYSQMPTVKFVGACDADADKVNAVVEEFGGKVFASPAELAREVQAATVATPTVFHYPSAEPLLKAGVACLIEKPLAQSAVEARRIKDLAAAHGAIVQVGHIERFNPAIRAMSELDVRPKFLEVTRISPLTFRSIDVGVVLDMMIHDIDIVLRMAGSTVSEIRASGVNVIGDVEDVCNVRLTFANGCVANLTASRLAMKTERKLRVFSENAYVSIDYQKRYGIVVQRTGNVDALKQTVADIKSGAITDLSDVNFTDLVNVQELTIDDVEPLRAQLDAFVHAAQTKTTPLVSAADGLAAVELAEKIVEAIGKSQ